MRASNARPYIIVGSADNIVGATIGRPLLRLCRQSVTVSAQLKLLPMSVAKLPQRQVAPHPWGGARQALFFRLPLEGSTETVLGKYGFAGTFVTEPPQYMYR